MTRGATLDALVVDDEPFARSGLRMLLEDDEDITSIREAASGRAAIDAMAARRPDLVLLDVQMPGMSGFEVARRLIRQGAAVRVLMMSAHDEPQYEAIARAAGADAFVTKKAFLSDGLEAYLG